MMRAELGSLVASLRRGPHGAVVLRAAIGIAIILSAAVVGVWWASARYVVAWTISAIILLIQLATLIVLVRLRAQANDIRYALSFESAVARKAYVLREFFMDGAAGTPSLQLCSLKILTLCQPGRVLELGSGQSTKLLSAYARETPNVYVLTLEQDASWASRIGPLVAHDRHVYRHVPVVQRSIRCEGTRLEITTIWYDNPPEVTAERWNYILVDGPDDGKRGTEHTDYARAGLLQYIPKILGDPFVVLFDDADAYKYQMTISAFLDVLRACNVRHVTFTIHGMKDQVVVCSPQWAFLASV